MAAIGVVAAAIATVVALAIQWLPTSASEEMDRIEFVYWFATIICIGIFAVVAAALVYIVWAFRAKPGDDTDGPPIHGNSGLEIAWTAIPAVLVVAIGVVSAVVLSRNADAGPNPLTIKVYAQQFAWYFEYPDAGDARSNELVMPVNRGITFEMKALDVIHSFWIPQMGQKQDLVPGLITKIVVTPTRTGPFTLICTELCGLGHATMRAPARVVGQGDFDAFLADLKAGASGGSGGAVVAVARRTARRCSRRPGAAAVTRSPRREAPPRSAPASTTSPLTPRRPACRSTSSCVSRSSTRARCSPPATPTASCRRHTARR